MRRPKYLKFILISLTLFLFTSVMGTALHIHSVKKQITASRSRCYNMAENQAHLIENIIDKILIRLTFIDNLIVMNKGDTSFFDEIAPSFYNQIYNEVGLKLRNFSLAPNGIVEKVYPLRTNEAFVGFDFTDLSQPGNEEAYLAYKQGRIVLTAPFSLTQGGTGIAARLPVYLDPDTKEQLWGLITVTMNFDEFIKILGLDYFDSINMNYEFCYADRYSKSEVISSSGTKMYAPVSYPVMQNNLNLFLRIEPVQGWDDRTQTVLFELLILIGCLFLSIMLYNSLKVRELNKELSRTIQYDPLAKCYSRSFLNSNIINPQTGKWRKADGKYSVAIIDIDNFKKINDTYGHEFGDRVIESVTYQLKRIVLENNSGYVVRYGGDEFLLLLNAKTEEALSAILQGCVTLVSQIEYEEYPAFGVTISIGAAFLKNNESYDELFRTADRHLYESKQNGKNQFSI